jgi:CheY-like chemotaxis protein
MSTHTEPEPVTTEPSRAIPVVEHPAQPDIKIYSHSPILYWWPVWVVGFLMALLTYLDGGRLAYVPAGTQVEGNRLVAPAEGGALEPPLERVAHNPYLGTWLFLTLLVVFVCSNVQMRGLWEWVSILAIAFVITLGSLYGLWDTVLDWMRLLHIRINLAGYLFLATWMFAIWAVSVFIFDRRTYIIFSSGQVRVRDMIGEGRSMRQLLTRAADHNDRGHGVKAMAASAILLVDDDQDTCASLSDIISDLGYQVDVAYDGPGALELSRRHPYGLALLDFKLPGMDGVELYGHLKQVRADTVGVLVTVFAAQGTFQAAIGAGIRRVLPKPVDFGVLLPLIQEVAGTP